MAAVAQSQHTYLLALLPQLSPSRRLPAGDAIWEQIIPGGAAHLVDAILSLPALTYVLLFFGEAEMLFNREFDSIMVSLHRKAPGLLCIPLMAKHKMHLDAFWPQPPKFCCAGT